MHRQSPKGFVWSRLVAATRVWASVLPVALAVAESGPSAKPPPEPDGFIPLTQLPVTLVRDPLVQSELKMTTAQKAAVRRLMDEVDGALWPLRDVPPARGADRIRPILERVDAGLRTILRPDQGTRLDQITLRAQGLPALRRPEIAERLRLADAQRRQVRAIVTSVRDVRAKVLETARDDASPQAAEKAAARLQAEEHERIQALLTTEQKRQWLAMIGRPFNLARLAPPPFKAPEVAGADAWINSSPLTLGDLRGKVVALHFWTFGCSNCVHNYPAYKAWQDSLVPKGLTIIGIHTPETQGERDADAVKRKAEENGLRFPIAIDNERKTWDAWGNSVWPSVYLIDKKGYVRYWWYGELNWRGAEGEKLMEQRIAELLAEKG